MSVTTATATLKVAVIGNPNTGKSTLFNALAGLHTRVGNYPGVTVEKKIGRIQWDGRAVELIDLPGTYSLAPRSLDEMVSVDVLLGRQPQIGSVDATIVIADASSLDRQLFLLGQILDTGVPTVLVLNMWDSAQRAGLTIDVERLQQKLGIPVVVTEAHRRRGLDDVRRAVLSVVGTEPPRLPKLFPEAFYRECEALQQKLEELGQGEVPWYLRERMLLDAGGTVEERSLRRTDERLAEPLAAARKRLSDQGIRVATLEAECRHAWTNDLLGDVVTYPEERKANWTDRLDSLLTHRVFGLLVFVGLMFLVFQAIYTWAGPLMELCEAGQEAAAEQISAAVEPGPLRSLLVDGVVAGVGGVLIFLPQIILLFAFIAILEDCGYMARGAYIMDRVMAAFGLSGKSFLPLMSSFACAIPGIMATRVIDNHRDRMVTILVAPLMSCSARLPVYLLLIAAFIPQTMIAGWISLQGLVLFGISSLGLLVAIPVAWLLKTFLFRSSTSAFVMELPEYKIPSVRMVVRRVYDAALAFVLRAGTLIFAATLLIWAAGYYPGDRAELHRLEVEMEQNENSLAAAEAQAAEPTDEALDARLDTLAERHNLLSAQLVEESYLGRAGHLIEPVVRPLGWDWRIGVGALASFPAREVIISTLGTIYSLGGDVDEESEGLRGALANATWPDGSKVFNVPVALSIMVFFALCAQCASTLVIMKRETNSWRWPLFSFVYMTTLAYVGAWLTYQIGMMFV